MGYLRREESAAEGLHGESSLLFCRNIYIPLVFSPTTARRFPKGNEGKTQGGLPLGNPVCLWQTELFKLNLKSSPSSSGYNRRRRLAPRSSGKQQAERTAVRAASIVCPEESPLLAAIIDNFDVKNSPLMGIDAPTLARGEDLHPSWGTYLLRRRSEGGAGGRAESPQCARRRKPLPRRGLTRRLRRGLGLAVPRGAHTFLSVAKEKCAKESQRHGDSGKKPFIAHF